MSMDQIIQQYLRDIINEQGYRPHSARSAYYIQPQYPFGTGYRRGYPQVPVYYPYEEYEDDADAAEDESSNDDESAQYRLEDLIGPYFTRKLTRPGKRDGQFVVKQSSQTPREKSSRDAAAAPTGKIAPPSAAEQQQVSETSPKEPKLKRRSSTTLNMHAKHNEPKIDPLQISAPQLKTNLPFSPAVNVYDFPDNYIIALALPGVSKEFVDIEFHPTSSELVVKGELKNKYLSDDSTVDNSKILRVSEQRFGSFERVIKLPSVPDVKEEAISAKFQLGMLEIKVPKLKDSEKFRKPRKITLEEIPDEELERESQNS
ncbi:hypothetical protein KL930_003183 [Ogataea haglerorum]|uniref:SHSP domain-containing protein n=2 Tax=Ogataea haglerorum TaxID=1937702 RepID=A0ABQ7RHR4_9ASCO|nr:hypothetical protein KL915_002520 [Ogataea haglerorum]KAG7738943.1 hypothetical protein KL923_002743 [Ogataea haglerorum]KAG7765895.1 hypothetical protein KL946_002075 [Ogataea haglerorum]KAG7776061.1 hypothetical protein KL930_003183 [Ogataea haglerorum]KAG7784036.1 hypothetical protein KL945_004725 [Ogataea haglerorum]